MFDLLFACTLVYPHVRFLSDTALAKLVSSALQFASSKPKTNKRWVERRLLNHSTVYEHENSRQLALGSVKNAPTVTPCFEGALERDWLCELVNANCIGACRWVVMGSCDEESCCHYRSGAFQKRCCSLCS